MMLLELHSSHVIEKQDTLYKIHCRMVLTMGVVMEQGIRKNLPQNADILFSISIIYFDNTSHKVL